VTEAGERLAALVATAHEKGAADHVAPVTTRPCIAWRTSARWFAVPVEDVVEVVAIAPITRVPETAPHVLGVTLIRSRLVAVADLDVLLGGKPFTIAPNSRLVVVRCGGAEVAFLALHTRGVIPLATGAGTRTSAATVRWIVDEIEWEDELLSMVDPAALVDAALGA
jgi:chemotaxis signal transduction protein